MLFNSWITQKTEFSHWEALVFFWKLTFHKKKMSKILQATTFHKRPLEFDILGVGLWEV